MKTNRFKRTLCSILAFVMVLGYVPATAFASEADGLCEHHTQHTAECGYSPAVEAHDCGHVHTDDCYDTVTACVHAHGECGYVPAVEGHGCDCQPNENGEIVHTEGCGYVEAVAEVPCDHVCSEETGCITDALNCQHQHDAACGYAEAAAETPCDFVCQECKEELLQPDDFVVATQKRFALQRSYEIEAFSYPTDYPNTHTNTGNQANDIAMIALTQVGYTEGDSNHTKYNVWYYGYDNQVAWGAVFVSWCADQAEVSCIAKSEWAYPGDFNLTASAFGAFTPQIGDIVFLEVDGNVNVDNSYGYDNVGIVCAVDDAYVTVVEGNRSDKVGTRKYSLSTGKQVNYTAYIAWISRPAYSTPHTHSLATASEAAHPHKEYEWCTDPSCDYWAYTGKTTTVSNCVDCFPPVYYCFDLNGYLDNKESPDLGDYGTCDVYINGERVADDCTDYYNSQIRKGSTYEIRDIRAKEGYDYINDYKGPLSGTVTSNTEVSLRIFTKPKLTLLTSQITLDLVNTKAKNIDYKCAETGYQYVTYISCSDLDVAGTDSTQSNSITVTAKKAGTCSVEIVLRDLITHSIVYDSATCQITVLPSGYCGDNLTWILENGTLTISGSGPMANYTDVSPDGTQCTPAPWYSVRESITKIVIGEGVTSIGSWAFYNCTNATSVSIPSSVTSIGEAAFFGCAGLTEVMLPSRIAELGNLNFAYCTSLSSISLPDSLKAIWDNAFLGCTQLRSIAIPESVSYIGGGSFQGCTSLASVNIPSSVASIGMYAFFDCTALKAVTIPDTVMFIGDWAFGFYGEAKPYSKVDSFVITTPRASEGYFYAKEHDIELITQGVFVPNFMFVGVAARDLTVNTYYDNAVLGSIPKGDKVQPYVVSYMNMGDDPDQGLVMGIQDTDGSITWGKLSAEELADKTKELVRGWVSLDGVKKVPYGTCGDHLTWILVDGVLTISGTGEMDGMVAQNIECVGPWKAYKDDIRSVVIEEGVTSIGAQCFTYCTNLESVTIPSTVEHIDPFAFFGTGLKQVSIPAGVREIGHAAFSNCSSLERIVAEGNNDDADFRVVDGVLYDKDMKYLQVYPAAKPGASFTVPDSVTYIDDYACVSAQFTEVILPQGLSGIGLNAFAGCANLEKILIPSSVSRMRESAFENCNRLTTIIFDHSVTDALDIGENAFSLDLPVSTKVIVQDVKDINASINGYDWAGSNRNVFYFEKNRLDLGDLGLSNESSVWIDGVEYPVLKDDAGSAYVIPPDGARIMVIYTYNNPNATDVHTKYPTGMKVWKLKQENGVYTAEYVPEFDNLLQYSGSSIRITGNKGIRMITSVNQDTRNALTGNGLAGFKLLEYGTLLAQTSKLGNRPLILENTDVDGDGKKIVRSNYAYKRGVADPVFKYTNGLIQYTNALIGFTDEQCKEDIAMRPYMKLLDENGEEVIIYGGIIYRSIGYIAYQNRNAFQPGSAAYEYVWSIIHNVYDNQYDKEYKK